MELIKQAKREDLAWVNERYTEIGFKPSSFEDELILILEAKNEKAALGRLVHVTSEINELGGIYVLPPFRGQGLAEKIVQELLLHRPPHCTTYCLPFAKLESFYTRLGFRNVQTEEFSFVPKVIRSKHDWCNRTYEDQTLLMIYQR